MIFYSHFFPYLYESWGLDFRRSLDDFLPFMKFIPTLLDRDAEILEIALRNLGRWPCLNPAAKLLASKSRLKMVEVFC